MKKFIIVYISDYKFLRLFEHKPEDLFQCYMYQSELRRLGYKDIQVEEHYGPLQDIQYEINE